MSTIRQLCAALGAPAAPPHVLAGVTSILTLPPPHVATSRSGTAGQRKTDKIPALIVAVYLFVAARLSGEETSSDDYVRKRDTVMSALREVEVGKERRETITARDVDLWLMEVNENGWQTLDWFDNIGEGTGLGLHGTDEGNEVDEDSHVVVERTPLKQTIVAMRAPKRDTLQPGLGTMVNIPTGVVFYNLLTIVQMQDKLDYLSEERRLDYLEWKAGILARIQEIKHG